MSDTSLLLYNSVVADCGVHYSEKLTESSHGSLCALHLIQLPFTDDQ